MNCYNKLQPAYKITCNMCGIELKRGDRCLPCLSKPKLFNSVSYCYVYNKEVFKLINGFKNYDRLYLLTFIVNRFVSKLLEKNLQNEVDLIIPVPVYYTKLIKRRYNHMALLGHKISQKTNLLCKTDILQKSKKTKDQMRLNGKKRLSNVKSAFNINKKYLNYLKGKNILLIDDILTTGSTINECAYTLKKSGAKDINVLCLARVDGFLKI